MSTQTQPTASYISGCTQSRPLFLGASLVASSGLSARIYLFWEKMAGSCELFLVRRTALMDSWTEHHCSSSAELEQAQSSQRDPADSGFLKDAHGVSVLCVFKYISLVKQTGWWGTYSPSTAHREYTRHKLSKRSSLIFQNLARISHEDLH